MLEKPIYVTKPVLPDLEDFVDCLKDIWKTGVLTNGGPFHERLERELEAYLGVKHVSLFNNGTIALLAALRSLEIRGQVITTPYSFVATSHSLIWNGIEPVFVDIDPITLNLDPNKIEEAITSETTAILPVHCYGNPCDVYSIEAIADKNNLKVIYDAAHAFGVRSSASSILNHGDLSILSFHATKVFNTFEGGAIISHDLSTKRRIDAIKNFGFEDEVTVNSWGINGKMSEINAALGLLQLKDIDAAIEKRAKIDKYYRRLLSSIDGIECLPNPADTKLNFSYFPIRVKRNFFISRDKLFEIMREKNIIARRYFYPLISDFSIYNTLSSSNVRNVDNARSVANEILCLPIYPDLSHEEIDFIVNVIREAA